MKRRSVALLASLALAASVFQGLPAQAAPAIPAEPNIVDPAQDANGINDQGTGQGVGDNSTPAYFEGPDFLNIWFTNTADSLEVHFNTSGNPEGGNYAWLFRVWVNEDCQTLEARFTGATNPLTTESSAQIREWCGDTENIPGEIVTEEIDDGTFITTVTVPLGQNPGIAMGSTLTDPDAVAHTSNPAVLLPVMDTTAVGTEYVIAEGEEAPAVEEEEEKGKKDKAPAKKGCKKKKGKGKKKGCKKGKGPKEDPPAAEVCPAYVPGEHGAEAETLMVTDSATEEEPVTLEFDAGVGLGAPIVGGVPVPPDQRTHNYHNVQVDSDSPEVGLYVRLEFTDRRDYDLYLEYPDGTEGTHSGDFNTAHEVFSCGDEATGCEGGSNFEQVNGIRTADCQGWTTDSVAFLSEGGDVTLSLWLGEIQNDPAPPPE